MAETKPAEQPESLILGITPRNWAILIACLLTLYLFLGLYYFSLMTIAYEARGSQYMRLPNSADMFGDFSRDNYYPTYGHPIEKQMMVYPWIKAQHCAGYTADMVCAHDDLIFTAVDPDSCKADTTECKLF